MPQAGAEPITSALVVDDDEAVRSVTAKMLARIGCETRTASSGDEALSILRESPNAFSVLMLDVNLPLVGGETPFDRIRRLRPDIPVLFVSGDHDHECPAPQTGFLEKPFSIEDLRRALSELVKPRRRREGPWVDSSTSTV